MRMNNEALQGCPCAERPVEIKWEIGAGRHGQSGSLATCAAHFIQRRCQLIIELDRRYPAVTPRITDPYTHPQQDCVLCGKEVGRGAVTFVDNREPGKGMSHLACANNSIPGRGWRALVRVVSVSKDAVMLAVPGWKVHTHVERKLNTIPAEIHDRLQPGNRLHAIVNLTAENASELRFENWEKE